MTKKPLPKDLVILTADKQTQFALQGLFSRFKSLGIRQLAPDYYVHPAKDPGVLRGAHDFLRPFTQSHRHALIVMDREGSGKEALSRAEMEKQLEDDLRTSGWEHRAGAVVIDPELEMWVWSDSPHVDTELGWTGRQPDLRTWLRQEGFLGEAAVKPDRPKEALEAALRIVRTPRSSAIYQALGEKVSLARCTDLAFIKLKGLLCSWFPQS